MSRPNFIIVGAPKCGTTALSEYLREHPNVFVSTPKEVHYFSTDMPHHGVAKSKRAYLELFSAAGPEHHAVGEASVWYLYSTCAAQNIRTFRPDMKLIVMLRNPADLAYSMHSQSLYNLWEDETDFGAAWRLCDARRAGERIPDPCDEPRILLYDELAALGAQLERLLGVFPREQVAIIFFEDFVCDTEGVYESVLAFLGLPLEHDVEFRPHNQNATHRYTWLSAITEQPPEALQRMVRTVKSVTGAGSLNVMRKLRNWNLVETERPPLEAYIRRAVLAHYRSDIETLARLTGRNLDHWLE